MGSNTTLVASEGREYFDGVQWEMEWTMDTTMDIGFRTKGTNTGDVCPKCVQTWCESECNTDRREDCILYFEFALENMERLREKVSSDKSPPPPNRHIADLKAAIPVSNVIKNVDEAYLNLLSIIDHRRGRTGLQLWCVAYIS